MASEGSGKLGALERASPELQNPQGPKNFFLSCFFRFFVDSHASGSITCSILSVFLGLLPLLMDLCGSLQISGNRASLGKQSYVEKHDKTLPYGGWFRWFFRIFLGICFRHSALQQTRANHQPPTWRLCETFCLTQEGANLPQCTRQIYGSFKVWLRPILDVWCLFRVGLGLAKGWFRVYLVIFWCRFLVYIYIYTCVCVCLASLYGLFLSLFRGGLEFIQS